MSNENTIRETFLDAAATQAVGAHTAEEAQAFTQDLAAASPAEQRAARDLHEAAARLAAASPYMRPPEDLRGKILAATAPASFKMEDYRKAMRDDARFWRWGLIAATLFLVAAAYWNMNLQGKNANLVAAVQTQDKRLAAMTKQVQGQAAVLSMIIDKNAEQITLRNNQGITFGKAFVDANTNRALVFLPAQMLEEGKTPALTIDHGGKRQVFETVVMAIVGNSDNSPAPGVAGSINVSNVLPDVGAPTPMQATIHY